jgi:hypothetical protein
VSNALTPALAVTSHVKLRRRRELPISGEVIVREGDTVQGAQIVARALLEGELRLVRAAELLGIPAEDLASVLKVGIDDEVAEGAVLAELRGLWGLFKSTVVAPIGGRVEFVSGSTGHVGIRAASRPLELPAYIPGKVVAVEPGRSVVVESECTFVQGIFGVGGERQGTVHILPISPTTPVAEAVIPPDLRGAIVVGGHSPTIGALRAAANNGAVGFITGSIDDRALREYLGYDIGVALTGDEAVSMTVIITEGFGSLPMSARTFNTIKQVNGEIASINGATQVRAGAQRPEFIAPMRASASISGSQAHGLEVGERIRVIRVPFFGATGRITELPHELQKIETGALVRVLRAVLDDGRQVTVPRANVELLQRDGAPT